MNDKPYYPFLDRTLTTPPELQNWYHCGLTWASPLEAAVYWRNPDYYDVVVMAGYLHIKLKDHVGSTP